MAHRSRQDVAGRLKAGSAVVVSPWEQRWRERVEAWRQSGQKQKEFCRAQGISVSSFSHWKCKLARRDAPRSEEPAAPVAARRAVGAGQGSVSPAWTEVQWPPA